LKIAIALLLIVAGSLAQASPGIYKWVDADGHVHFSDCPPEPEEKCRVEELAVDTGPPPSEEELQRRAARRAAWMRELHQRAEAKQKQQKKERAERRLARAQEAEFSAQQCTLARNNLEQLLLAKPVYRYRLDRARKIEQQREDETLKDIATMLEIIDQYCED
jgi:cell division protein FtsN